MPRGRPIPRLTLTAEERETRQGWAQRRKAAKALALRVRVVLACAEGKSNTAVAAALRLCKPTVGKRRGGSVGNLDVARPGVSREIDTPR